MSAIHFLLTRWNVPMHQRPGQNLDPVWLAERLELFTRYCLPSVRKQTLTHDFTWLLAVDDRTPPDALAALLRCGLPSYAHLVLIRPADEFKSRLRSVMAGMLEAEHEAVVSTRLDSDDAITPGYLHTAFWTAATKQLPCFIDTANGYTYETAHDRLRPRSYAQHPTALSPFLSFAEPKQEGMRLHTAFCGDHGQLRGKYPKWPVWLIDEAWVQVLHGNNVANAIGADEPFPRGHLDALKRSLGWISS